MKPPPGWHRTSLRSICKIGGGIGFSKDLQGRADGAYPFIKVSDMNLDGNKVYIKRANNWIDEETRQIIGGGSFPAGSVVLPKVGAALGTNKRRILLRDTFIDNNLMALVPTDIDPEFLFQWSLALDLSSLQQESAIPSVNAADVGALQILIPPESEQRKIAEILGAWDRAIEVQEMLLDVKTRRLRGLRHYLLTEAPRLPGLKKSRWPRVALAKVAENVSRRNRTQIADEHLFAVTKAAGMIPMRERVKGSGTDRCKVVEHDWFAYNPMRINIGSIARWQGQAPVMVSPDYVVFRCRTEVLLPDYLDHVRRSDEWNNYVSFAGNGSVRVRIYFRDLGHFKFPLPPIPEQARIAAILNACEQEIQLTRRELEARRKQKRGLMQKLLTGEVRVKI